MKAEPLVGQKFKHSNGHIFIVAGLNDYYALVCIKSKIDIFLGCSYCGIKANIREIFNGMDALFKPID
jgi:hypothetical protein